jgi:hypothetical protein
MTRNEGVSGSNPLGGLRVRGRFPCIRVFTASRRQREMDLKTTQIYAHYAPSTREVQEINEAFGHPERPTRPRRARIACGVTIRVILLLYGRGQHRVEDTSLGARRARPCAGSLRGRA